MPPGKCPSRYWKSASVFHDVPSLKSLKPVVVEESAVLKIKLVMVIPPFGPDGNGNPDHASPEGAIWQPQRERRIENKIRVHELARSPAGGEFIRVAVQRVQLADEHA